MNLFTAWRRFRSADGGSAGTEFALLSTFIMVPLLLGSVELIDVLGVNKRAQNAAASLADIVARDTEVSDDEIDGYWSALELLLYPDSPNDMRITLTAVSVVSSSNARVIWSEAHGAGAAARNPGDSVSLDGRMMIVGTSIVMAETEYSYQPPLHFLFPSDIEIDHVAYRRSRLIDPIPRVD